MSWRHDDTPDPLDRVLELGFRKEEMPSVPPVGGRYRVVGEIARGGMGIVLKGHDAELGRSVAIKVLHERFQDDASLRDRFIEEAQIGGQLQHPGVVPVYDLNRAEGRPFIAMKLIEGRTLAALLAERKSPDDDRRRFLGTFEQVCQTMAYAHARGVVHRDLKPANVMIGSFGEVHVVDWGLAKVLRAGPDDGAPTGAAVAEVVQTVRSGDSSSRSRSGSVMGTPAYMSPEQARGAVEAMDARSDVFSLGAILCELLTGLPPYTGASAEDILAAASAGATADALARLERSGADAEIVGLAKDCLSADPTARPPDAADVAGRVGAYLTGVEQRAQSASIAAAEERVRAIGARKAQRLTAALAGTLVLAVLAGAGVVLWQQHDQAARAARAASAVADAVTEVERLRSAARGAPEGELGPWPAVTNAVRTAQALAASREVEDDRRRAVQALAAAVAAEEAEAQDRVRRAEADRRMLETLDSILTPDDGIIEVEFDVSRDARRRQAAYAAAFRGYGIDLEALTPEEAASRLRASAIASSLAAAIDDWSFAKLLGATDGDGSRRLLAISRDADPDPWRRTLRDVLLDASDAKGARSDWKDPARAARLRDLYAKADLRSLPAVTFLVLGRLLYLAGAEADGLAVLRRGQELHPEHFTLAYSLAILLHSANPQQLEDAARFFTAARSIRSSSLDAAMRLGITLDQCGRQAEALRVLEDAGRVGPASAVLRATLAMALYRSGRPAEALASAREAIDLRPDFAVGQAVLGIVHYALQHPGEAEAAYRQSLRLAPDDAVVHANLGIVLYETGRREEGILELERCLAINRKLPAIHNNLAYTREQQGRLLEAIDGYREAVRLDARYSQARFNLGRLLFLKEHRYHEALRAFEEAARLGYQDREDWAGDVRREIARLEARLGAVERGEGPPPDAAERERLAKLCLGKGLHAEAAALFREAFAAEPALASDLTGSALHDAAAAAMAAGTLDWARQARAWLERELGSWQERMKAGPEAASRHARGRIGQWLEEPELAPARDTAAIAELPAEEREAWAGLWARVREAAAER